MSEIKIRCPKCKECFDVSGEMMGFPIECAACQHPFDLSNEHVDKLAIRQFPGDKAQGLKGFSKRIPNVTNGSEVHFRTASYDQEMDPNAIMPLGPRRLLAISAGVTLMGLVILFFVLGNGELGAMTDVADDKRWVLAGFSALVGSLLIIFGFRKYRTFGVIFALVLATAVCSMPIIYPAQLSPVIIGSNTEIMPSEPLTLDPDAELLAYKISIGYASVQSKIAQAADPEKVVAVALMRAKPAYLDTIKDYLARALNTDEVPRVYTNRELNDQPCILLVYLNSKQPLEKAALLIGEFGTVMKVRKDLQIVEVVVEPSTFKNSKFDVLVDDENPQFYQANLAELKHIDQERQLAAVQRLSKTQKFFLRADIARQFQTLIELESLELKLAAVEALARWDRADQDNASALIVSQARKFAVNQKIVPQSYLNYLLEQKVEEVGDILLYAWMKERVLHEVTLIRAGKIAEVALIDMLPELEPVELDSAANVLRKIGTSDALPSLLIAYELANEDVKKSLKATIDEIKSRE
ncbi:MAG: hypothetical protein ABGY95_07100 [Rubritalea sp.]|uniref:hypothetical protein n=1 Tax=Rubritalea sp. TaxID=2109375 RepID=UPI00324284D9